MNFTRFTRPLLIAASFILIISLLPGFKGQQADTFIHAPLNEPAAMFYHNLAVSGIYNRDETAKEALAEINESIKNFLKQKGIKKEHNPENLFEKKFLNNNQRPEELYFYFKNRTKFAFILSGEFDVERLKQQMGRTDTGSSTILIELDLNKDSDNSYNELVLWADAKLIALCPKVSSKEIISRLQNNQDYLHSRFTTFKKMLKGKPALAGEIDLELLKQGMASSTIRMPETLNVLKHLRFIGDARLTKAQLYAPETQKRELLHKEIETGLELFNNFFNKVATFSVSSKGNSLFLEAEAGLDAERTLSRKVSAFIIHFFESRQNQNSIVLTSKIDNEEKN
ncbi:MAG: hypothetical protein ACQETH_06350 [Candidatus Rifleibacteriota bacterium]